MVYSGAASLVAPDLFLESFLPSEEILRER